MVRKTTRRPGAVAHSSTLPFDPADLMKVRVSPARFAEICGVSRQSVSKWIKSGWVTIGPDGLLDPAVASRQYMDCVNPTKMRARVFKDTMATIPELRARIQSLEAEVAGMRQAVTNQCRDDFAKRIRAFCDAILSRFDELQAARAAGNADEWINLLEARVIWDFDDESLEEMRADFNDSREALVEKVEA